jgi:hypothetical protein
MEADIARGPPIRIPSSCDEIERVVISAQLMTALRRHCHEAFQFAETPLQQRSVVLGIEQAGRGLANLRGAIRSGAKMHAAAAFVAQIQLEKCGLLATRECRLCAALFLQLRKREFEVLAGPSSLGGWPARPRDPHYLRPGHGCNVLRLKFQKASGYGPAFSRREAPELCVTFTLSISRGRRESRVRAAPAVSRAMCIKNAHTSIQVQRRASGLRSAATTDVCDGTVIQDSRPLDPERCFDAYTSCKRICSNPTNETPHKPLRSHGIPMT